MNHNIVLETYAQKKEEIKKRLQEFKKIDADALFYELCFCILTPQTSGERSWQTVLNLKEKDFFSKNINPKPFLTHVRFHNNKSKNLLEAKKGFPEIKETLKKISDSFLLREWLVENVRGYGYKEASHFLRNIGYENLAILDRHILRNLVKLKIIDELPKTLTKKKYLEIEHQFKHFSKEINIPLDELDLLFWSMETGKVFK